MSLLKKYGPKDQVSLEAHATKEKDPVADLFLTCNTISNEASIVGDTVGYFAKRFSSMAISIKDGFRYLTTFTNPQLAPLNPGQMSTWARRVDYTEIEDIAFPQPLGFTANINDYVASLKLRAAVAATLVQKVIDPCAQRLGHYVSAGPERSDRRDFVAGSTRAITEVDSMIAEDAKFFRVGDRNATARFGDLYHSINDFVKAEQDMQQIAEIINSHPTAQVKAQVAALGQIAEALLTRLSRDTDPASKEFIKQVGNDLQEVARWVEWYAALMIRITDLNQVLVVSENKLRSM